MRWHAFCALKRGDDGWDFEDAFGGDAQVRRWAIADGATGSCFAGAWARRLAREFVRGPAPRPGAWDGWLPRLRAGWLSEIENGPFPWYVEAKLEMGAFATFLGLQMSQGRGAFRRRWRATAVGDSCLFRLRRNSLIDAFPITCSSDFGSTPSLVGSRSRSEPVAVFSASGQWEIGDLFLLMTDALAQWFLKEAEAGGLPQAEVLDLLHQVSPSRAFPAWVDMLRDEQGLRDDDVTLVVIHPAPAAAIRRQA
jgi:hypothetical protein